MDESWDMASGAETTAAQRLRAILARASADPEIGPAEQLVALLDQALADAESDGVRRLARTIPHELGQPLTEVRGYAELLAHRRFPPSEQIELMQRIAAAATRLGTLMHAVGRLAESDGSPPERRDFAGYELVALHAEPPAG
jgi:signal transduction histidine kinase